MDNNLFTGKQFDQYLIEKHLARGGMAEVYLARDISLQRDVVIKVMLPHLAAQEPLRLRFQREAVATAKLQHPNIVPVYTTGNTPDGLPYIALQYVEGGSLSDLLQKLSSEGNWISAIYALAITRQMADALTVAHAANIIHRDLKPSNILLRKDGAPVLSDLGIAAIQQATFKLTQTGGVIGTPDYMSPEQAGSQLIDGRSDIYSLGVILYELLSGRLPFEANSPLAMLHSHIYEQPAPLEQVRPDLTPQTYQVVAACLQKSPDDRYPDAAALLATLDEALAAENNNPRVAVTAWQPAAAQKIVNQAQHTPSQTPTQVLQPQKSSKWPLMLAGLLLLLLLCGGGGYAAWQQFQANDLPSQTTTPAPLETPAAEIVVFETETAVPPQPMSTAKPEDTAVSIPEPAEIQNRIETYTVNVPANSSRFDTGIQLAPGQSAVVEVLSGVWRAGPASNWPEVGPAGDPQIPGKNSFPVPDAAVVSLIGGIGNETPIYIGSARSLNSPNGGALWLASNDDSYGDNTGSLAVSIMVDPYIPPWADQNGVIAYSCGSGANNQIYYFDLGTNLETILPNQPANSQVPAFSTNGSRLLFRSDTGGSWQIYVGDFPNGPFNQFTSGPANNYEMVFSPGGEETVFVSDESGNKDIYLMNADGRVRALTSNSDFNDDPTWSINDVIAFESNMDGRFNIHTILPDGSNLRTLIRLGDSSTTPAWSPDGSQIAFESRQGDTRHIWTASSEGANLERVTTVGNDNQRPAWSLDGRFLAFHSNLDQSADDQYDIWVIDIATGELKRISWRGCYDPAWAVQTNNTSETNAPQTAIVYAESNAIHVGDESDLEGWPTLHGLCYVAPFNLEFTPISLSLQFETWGVKANNPISVNGKSLNAVPVQGATVQQSWTSSQSVDLPTDNLRLGANSLEICAGLIEDDPDFAGDHDDFQFRNLQLTAAE